ncbi:hypothetical protein ZWY2020_033574 [Hordeum vulgare]|nr:hypothetical protein ZWY2020_033574 [Hordeum vulgare]
MNKNLGKRAAEDGSEDPQRKRQHVSEGPNSSDDGFVVCDFVRDVHSTRRKDGFPSKTQPKRTCVDGDDDGEADCDAGRMLLQRVATMIANMDYAAMAQMDFCQLVVDELQPGVAACDVHKDSYNGFEKDEELADVPSPPDVVVDKPGDGNIEVLQSVGVAHVDVEQGFFVVAGGDGVSVSLSVAVKSVEPSLA